MQYKIVETDNYGKDYPDEKFLNLPTTIKKEELEEICNKINDLFSSPYKPRYWKVVEEGYILQPGFEP